MWPGVIVALSGISNFYSHTSCEVWLFIEIPSASTFSFLLTHLMRGVTCCFGYFWCCIRISTHTPHARCDNSLSFREYVLIYFYSHTSCEVWPDFYVIIVQFFDFYSHTSCEVWLLLFFLQLNHQYFYSHTSCEVWHLCHFLRRRMNVISTHTPHARCDN